jgi:hypothetical protein
MVLSSQVEVFEQKVCDFVAYGFHLSRYDLVSWHGWSFGSDDSSSVLHQFLHFLIRKLSDYTRAITDAQLSAYTLIYTTTSYAKKCVIIELELIGHLPLL